MDPRNCWCYVEGLQSAASDNSIACAYERLVREVPIGIARKLRMETEHCESAGRAMSKQRLNVERSLWVPEPGGLSVNVCGNRATPAASTFCMNLNPVPSRGLHAETL